LASFKETLPAMTGIGVSAIALHVKQN
jgi:hypothetical protein